MNRHRERFVDAAFLLYQQVKVATALLLLKAKPEGLSIREFVLSIQYKFRERTSRYNLQLEKQIFRNQFIFLLPELKIYSIERHLYECYSTNSTQHDVKYELTRENAPATLSTSIEDRRVTSKTLKIRRNLQKIESICRFVGAIVKIEVWTRENRDIVLADLIRILRSLDILQGVENENRSALIGGDLIVSNRLLGHLVNSVDAERMITRASSHIILFFEEYFFDEYFDDECEIGVRAEALKTFQFANRTIFECLTTFPAIAESCERAMAAFLRKTSSSLPALAKNEFGSREAYSDWYSTFKVWKKEEFTCVETINTLMRVLKNEEDAPNFYSPEGPHSSQSASVSECNLALLKMFLISYHTMYISGMACPKQADIRQWENRLRITITESISRHPNTVRLAWHCLQLVLSFKLLMRRGNLKKL